MSELTAVTDQVVVLRHIPCGGVVSAWAADLTDDPDMWPDLPADVLSMGVQPLGELVLGELVLGGGLGAWCECDREENNDD